MATRTDARGVVTNYTYDSLGRVKTDRRTTGTVTKDVLYLYKKDGSLATLTYPSGRVVTYGYDNAARPLSAVDQASSTNYALAAQYSAHGALTLLTMGQSGSFTGIGLNQSFNPRLQPTTLLATSTVGTALSLAYDFDYGVANNGNVKQITNNSNTARTQTFTYDEVNRIKSAKTQATSGQFCWGQDFGYDIWANLKFKTPNLPLCPMTSIGLTIDWKNRIVDPGFAYDAAGNLTAEPGKSYTYDAENRMISSIVSSVTTTYAYDGDGKRVKKGTTKLYWYGTSADVLSESDAAGTIGDEFIFFGGKRIARRDSSSAVFYYLSDHLGSSRVITQANGTICFDADYLPFGEERAYTNTCPTPYKFTGKERDAESGLDFFIARYYSSNYGRFLSPDEFTGGPRNAFSSNDPLPQSILPYSDINFPQSLNKYCYAYNNPTALVDPDGHCPICVIVVVAVVALTAYGAYEFHEGQKRGMEHARAARADYNEAIELGLKGDAVGAEEADRRWREQSAPRTLQSAQEIALNGATLPGTVSGGPLGVGADSLAQGLSTTLTAEYGKREAKQQGDRANPNNQANSQSNSQQNQTPTPPNGNQNQPPPPPPPKPQKPPGMSPKPKDRP